MGYTGHEEGRLCHTCNRGHKKGGKERQRQKRGFFSVLINVVKIGGVTVTAGLWAGYCPVGTAWSRVAEPLPGVGAVSWCGELAPPPEGHTGGVEHCEATAGMAFSRAGAAHR